MYQGTLRETRASLEINTFYALNCLQPMIDHIDLREEFVCLNSPISSAQNFFTSQIFERTFFNQMINDLRAAMRNSGHMPTGPLDS